ncbi:MAG TPA: tetratricopeptide repeat protein [Saprospiraceae bacterium]|nr:tetratricopeptide repeat protein [Saprospiraceae bacterium]
MAKRKKQEDFDDVFIDVVESTGDARTFLEKNGNKLLGAIGLLALLVGGYFFYKYRVQEPKQKEAVQQMFQAQYQFDRDSFKLGLTNPGGGYPGFVDIVEQYSGTPAGNLANYYAAVSYLKLGDPDASLSYLKAFKPTEELLRATKNGMLGDIAGEKGDFDSALSYYKKAVASNLEVITPYYLKKMGLLLTKMGKKEEALKAFKEIKSKYPSSAEGVDIDKYL